MSKPIQQSRLSREDTQCLRLGKQVVRMIRDLIERTGDGSALDCGYARQHTTFPGGSVELIVATSEVADLLDWAARRNMDVVDATPRPEMK